MKSLPISLPLLASLTLPCLAAIAQNYTITRTPTFPTDADSQRLLNQGIFDFCAAEWKPTQDITTHLTIYTLEGPRAGTERTALVGPWVLLTAEIEDFKKAFGDVSLIRLIEDWCHG